MGQPLAAARLRLERPSWTEYGRWTGGWEWRCALIRETPVLLLSARHMLGTGFTRKPGATAVWLSEKATVETRGAGNTEEGPSAGGRRG